MKIVRLTEEFPYEINRGLAPNVYYISREQVRQGNQVWVFAFTKKTLSHEVKDGIHIYRIKKPHLVRWLGGITFARAIRKLNIEPDIIHGLNCIPFGWLFPLMKVILPTKYAMSLHGSVNPLKHGYAKGLTSIMRNWEFTKLSRFLAGKVDLILPITKIIRDELIESGIDNNKIEIISPGIDTDIFKPSATKKVLDKNNIKLLYVGRFSQMKGIEYLIKACNLLIKDNIIFTLSLIGGTKKDESYKKVFNLINKLKLGKHIKFIPPQSQHNLVKYYQEADIFILPSVYEPFGKVILEAMACGIPVIATNTGAAGHLIKDNYSGILVAPSDSQALYKKISTLLNDDELQNKMSTNVKNNSINLGWKLVGYRYSDTFKNIINNS